jgi:secreted Zn-dependent insulinase-like peptidase
MDKPKIHKEKMKVARVKKVIGYSLGVQTLKKNVERGEETLETIKQQIERNREKITLIKIVNEKYKAKPLAVNQKNLQSLILKFPLLEEQLKRKVTNPFLQGIDVESILASGSNNPQIFSADLTYCSSQIYYQTKASVYFNIVKAEKEKDPQSKVVKNNVAVLERMIKLTK